MSAAPDTPADDEWGAPHDAPPAAPRKSRAVWLGVLIGAVVLWALAFAEVTAVVEEWRDEQVRFGYLVRVLGVEVYRRPEHREVFKMRPWPQMIAWREGLGVGSIVLGAVLGGLAGRAFQRVTREPDYR